MGHMKDGRAKICVFGLRLFQVHVLSDNLDLPVAMAFIASLPNLSTTLL